MSTPHSRGTAWPWQVDATASLRMRNEARSQRSLLSRIRGRGTFAALGIPNFRIYMVGQLVSVSGNAMQSMAQGLLVLEITGSGTALGLVTALQFAPMLLLTPFGGLLADRVPKRAALYVTQSVSSVLALSLAVLVLSERVELWHIYVLAGGFGLVTSLDHPLRGTFIYELVGPEQLTNAVSLNSVMASLSRVLGPAIGGLIIATVGLGACFVYNAVSYVAVIFAMAAMRSDAFHPSTRAEAAKGQLREGFRYVRSTPELLVPLLLLGVFGTLAWQYPVVLPLLSRFTFHGGAGIYSAFSTLMGVGAITGGLLLAGIPRPTGRTVIVGTALFGVSTLLVATAPTVTMAMIWMVPLGGAGMALIAMLQSTLQLNTRPEMRGRVMGLFAMALMGSAPIGSPLVGWIGDHLGPRYGLGLGGVAVLVMGAVAYPALVRRRLDPAATPALPAALATPTLH